MSVEAEEEGGGEKENTVHNAEKERLRDMPTNKSLESRTSGLALASGNSYASMGASTYGAHYGITSVWGTYLCLSNAFHPQTDQPNTTQRCCCSGGDEHR